MGPETWAFTGPDGEGQVRTSWPPHEPYSQSFLTLGAVGSKLASADLFGVFVSALLDSGLTARFGTPRAAGSDLVA